MKKSFLIALISILLILTACGKPTKLNPLLAEELAAKFTLDDDRVFAKELEDTWKDNKDDVEISAMYFYSTARFYELLRPDSRILEIVDKSEMIKNSLKNINPEYHGVMADEIINYGLNIFENKDDWKKVYKEKQSNIKKYTESKRLEIAEWIEKRYEYYDELEGEYTEDKYTKIIYEEASEKFNFTYEEIYNIWVDLPL